MSPTPKGRPGDACDKTTGENRQTTRQEARKSGRTIIEEDHEEIKDARKGRKYLEAKQLLWPPGEPITLSAITICLHHISALANVPKPAVNAIRSVAYILEEVEETAMSEKVKEAVDSQMGELNKDLALLVSDVTERIDTHLSTKIGELTANVERLNNTISKAEETGHTTSHPDSRRTTTNERTGRSYANIVATPVAGINPRLAAKEGIKARQFMLEGIVNNAKLSHLTDSQLRDELNRTITQQGFEGKCIRSTTKQRLGGLLIETNNDDAANWIRSPHNQNALCAALGPGSTFRSRTFQMIALNVSLLLDPTNKEHLKEICEVNQLEDETISTIRWAKPIARRSPGQRSAHLIVTFTDVNEANRAVANGLTICNRRTRVEKIKKEPTRCLKCQGWNHFAKECLENHDTCGNCAENHRTSLCPNPMRRSCASCKVDTHASWSRACPVFLKKSEECNRRFPENALTFIPSSDPWTWIANSQSNEDQSDADGPRTTRKKLVNRDLRQYGTQENNQNNPVDDFYAPYGSNLPDWASDDPPNLQQDPQEETNRPHTRPTANHT